MVDFMCTGESTPFSPFPIRRAYWFLSRKKLFLLIPLRNPIAVITRRRPYVGQASRCAWRQASCKDATQRETTAIRSRDGTALDAVPGTSNTTRRERDHRRPA